MLISKCGYRGLSRVKLSPFNIMADEQLLTVNTAKKRMCLSKKKHRPLKGTGIFH
jgi:hypothetical protein